MKLPDDVSGKLVLGPLFEHLKSLLAPRKISEPLQNNIWTELFVSCMPVSILLEKTCFLTKKTSNLIEIHTFNFVSYFPLDVYTYR